MRTGNERIERLRSRLFHDTAGYRLVYEHETGSTNDLALEAAQEGAQVPCVFLADVQKTAEDALTGRGKAKKALP